MAEKPITPVKDINQIVRYLTNTFNVVTNKLDRAIRSKTGPNLAYELQTEFAYLLNEIMQGPRGVLQKNIAACNDYIDEVIQKLNESTDGYEQ